MSLSRWRSASFLSSYEFPGDDIPIVPGSALAALEGRDDAIGKTSIEELMAAVLMIMCRSLSVRRISRS